MEGKQYVSTGISMPVKLFEQVERERGDISRSRYLLKLIQKGLSS